MLLEALLRIAQQKFPEKELLTKDELALVLECDPKIIYNWARRPLTEKRPPGLKLGGETRFPKAEFIRWVVETQSR